MSKAVSHSNTVLVVDDSVTNRILLRGLLQAQGFEVKECSNGKECVALVEKEVPAIILLDIMMPEMNGLDACRLLREKHTRAELPIIMVSSLVEAGDVAEGLQNGANDYVNKPIDRRVLLARIESQLALSRAQMELVHQKQVVERALRLQNSLGNVLPEAILVHDEKGKIIYSNRQLEAACSGVVPQTIADTVPIIFGGVFSDRLAEHLNACLSNWELSVEFDLTESNGEFRSVRVVSRPVPLGNGRAERFWLFRDETEVRALQRRVSQQIKLDTVGLFAAGIAHNFNNILGGVLGAAELLSRMVGTNERAVRCVNLIRRGVDSGTRLTRKMGAITRRQASSGGSCDFQRVLDNATSSYQAVMAERIKFLLDVPAHLPQVKLADIQLLEVLASVVANAVESIEGLGEISIFVDWKPGASTLEVRITDTGCGMSDEVSSRLYEPFFSTKKLDKASGVSVEGRGLGLWNTYSLLKMNGGEMTIQSELGKGTEVFLKLPCDSQDPFATDAVA
ncbi:MAG: response regulator [Oligoflexia bacterium]|nr:response regulator [Oligoflexia bacterium]